MTATETAARVTTDTLEARVEVGLDALGATADEVAESLRRVDCGGVPCQADHCPLANYVRRLAGPAADVNVGIWDLSVNTDPEGGYDGGFFELPLPDACMDFVQAFDENRYPDMATGGPGGQDADDDAPW